MYSSDFPGQSVEDMRSAKPSLWRPDKGGDLSSIVGGKGKLLVTQSLQQSTHHGAFGNTYDANGETSKPQKDNLGTQGYHGGDFSGTSYHNEFNGRNQQRSQAVGSAFRQLQRSGSAPGRT